MNILLIYPKTSHHSTGIPGLFQHFFRKDMEAPRELIEIAIQLPITWERKMVDLNVSKLRKQDIKQADLIIVKAPDLHHDSAISIAKHCERFRKQIIVLSAVDELPIWSSGKMNESNLETTIDQLIPNTLEDFMDTKIISTYRNESKEYTLFEFSSSFRNRLQIITN